MLNGVARLVNSYGNNLKDEIFKEKLGNISLKEIARTARERRSGSLGYSEAMLNAYNAKMQKNTLAVTKPYSGKK